MNNNFKKLEQIYNEVYSSTLILTSCIEQRNMNELEVVLNGRGKLLESANIVRLNANFTEEEKKILNKLLAKIKAIEEKNISQLEKMRNEITNNIGLTTKNQKLLSAYKSHKESKSTLFDTKE